MHTFADKRMAGDFAVLANACAFLDFHKGADFAVVANFTTVQVDKIVEPDIRAQLDVVSDDDCWVVAFQDELQVKFKIKLTGWTL